MLLYLATWVTAVAVALVAAVWRRAEVGLFTAAYARHLAAPWKLVTFAAATALLVWAAPRSGDPTWDAADSVIVGVVTFATAPWSVAMLARAARARRLSLAAAVAAVLFWTPCWVYDAYILWRDGDYPPTAWSNLGISGAIVACAGLFWNLGEVPGRGAWFTFVAARWPPAEPTPFSRVVWLSLIFAVPVVVAVMAFVVLAAT